MQNDNSSPVSSQESLEALVRYLARCAAERDYQSVSQPKPRKEASTC